MNAVTVRVPASTANLGPGFDCLALAIDLWNETRVELGGSGIKIEISGEGESSLPTDETNMIYTGFARLYEEVSGNLPAGVIISAKNEIPSGAGLGSSGAATLTGLLAANALLGEPIKRQLLLQLGNEMEGHADNFGASLMGGLVLVSHNDIGVTAQKLDCADWHIVFISPELKLSTHESRGALPKQVALQDAVFNIGKAVQVAQALAGDDVAALAEAMKDRLHQPYRLPLVPGAAEALAAARKAGAAAAISGAGPGLIAFIDEGREKGITEAMRAPFAERGVKTQQYLLRSTQEGASVSS